MDISTFLSFQFSKFSISKCSISKGYFDKIQSFQTSSSKAQSFEFRTYQRSSSQFVFSEIHFQIAGLELSGNPGWAAPRRQTYLRPQTARPEKHTTKELPKAIFCT